MLNLKQSVFAVVLSVFAVPAAAESTHTVQAEIVKIEPRTAQQQRRVPVTECEIVQVPVYGTVREKGNAGSVITGMIIGGLAGKGATGDDGGAAVGAIIGGAVGAEHGRNRQVITGYREQEQCSTRYRVESETVISGYTITYEWAGLQSTTRTTRRYQVGDTLWVTVRF